MALNNNKSGFGFDMEARLAKKTTRPSEEGSEVIESETPKKEVQSRERKHKRIQILTYDSLVDRLDSYCDRKNVSRAAVFEAAISAYLDEFDV